MFCRTISESQNPSLRAGPEAREPGSGCAPVALSTARCHTAPGWIPSGCSHWAPLEAWRGISILLGVLPMDGNEALTTGRRGKEVNTVKPDL